MNQIHTKRSVSAPKGENLVREATIEDALQIARLHTYLYGESSVEDLQKKLDTEFTPQEGRESYKFFVVESQGTISATAHYVLYHNSDSQNVLRLVEKDGSFRLQPFSTVVPSTHHEIEVAGVVIDPAYGGRGIGSNLMRTLLGSAIADTNHTVTIAAKGYYTVREMEDIISRAASRDFLTADELRESGLGFIARNHPTSGATARVAEEMGLEYVAVSRKYGGPLYAFRR